MGKLILCRIDLNRHEQLKAGAGVTFEDGWDFSKSHPYVRPTYHEAEIGRAVTTEKIWDRHRPAGLFTFWRIWTMPFRPAQRLFWINLDSTYTPEAISRRAALTEDAAQPVDRRKIDQPFPPGRAEELLRAILGSEGVHHRMKRLEFRSEIDGTFTWDRRNRIPCGSAAYHPTLMQLTRIEGVSWVFLTSCNSVTIVRDWSGAWFEIERAVREVLLSHDAFLTKGRA